MPLAAPAFGERKDLERITCALNSVVGGYLLTVLNSSMAYLPRDIKNFPINESVVKHSFADFFAIAEADWDSLETSWNFKSNPIATLPPSIETLNSHVGYASRTIACEPHHSEKVRDAYPTLEASYQQWNFTDNPLIRQKQNISAATFSAVIPAGMPESSHRDVKLSAGTSAQSSICANATLPSMALDSGIPAGMTAFEDNAANPTYALTSLEQCFNRWQTQNRAAIIEMQRLEEENNRLFIEAYGLQDELSPKFPKNKSPLPVPTAKKTASG